MKPIIPKQVGELASTIFRLTAIPILAYSIYILYLAAGIRAGTIEMTVSDFYEFISSEISAITIALAGVLLIDLEEKNSEYR